MIACNEDSEKPTKHIVLVTGANFQISGPNLWVYNNARKIKSMGYKVTIICQDRAAKNMPDVDSYIQGQFPADSPKIKEGQLRVVVPDINGIIPVYASHQDCGFQGTISKPIQQMTQQQIQNNIVLTANCLRAICIHDRPFKVISNYMILTGIITARGLEGLRIPYDIIAPGPALRFTIMPNPQLWKYIFPGFQKSSRIFMRTQFTKRLFMKCFRNNIQQYQLDKKSITIGPGMITQNFKIAQSYETCQKQFINKIKDSIEQYIIKENQLKAINNSIQLKAVNKIQSQVCAKKSCNTNMQKNIINTRKQLLQNWQYTEQDELILYSGALMRRRGVAQLVAIAPKLIIQRPSIKFIICGSGPQVNELNELLNSYQQSDLEKAKKIAQNEDFIQQIDIQRNFIKINKQVRKRIIFTGLLDKSIIQALYPLCTLIICPGKLQEENSMGILEAMCCGVTPICNDHSWFADIMNVIQKQFPQLTQVTRVDKQQFYQKLPETIINTLKFIKQQKIPKKIYMQKIRSIIINHFSFQHTAKSIVEERIYVE